MTVSQNPHCSLVCRVCLFCSHWNKNGNIIESHVLKVETEPDCFYILKLTDFLNSF